MKKILKESKLMKFMEAASSNEFPSLLRADYQHILLDSYLEVPQPALGLCHKVTSINESETYAGMKPISIQENLIPQGGEFPEGMLDEKSTVTITNRKYGQRLAVTWEMLKYNKIADMQRLPALMGQKFGVLVEQKIIDVIETTANTSTSSGGTLSLNRTNLESLINYHKTQTTTDADGNTVKAGIPGPDTLLIPPDLEFEARRLLNSTLIPGSGNNDLNVLKSSLDIVVSPYLGSTSVWYVLKKNWANGLVFQSVMGPPPEISTQKVERNQMPDSSFIYDKISYRVKAVFGVGVLDVDWCIRSTN